MNINYYSLGCAYHSINLPSQAQEGYSSNLVHLDGSPSICIYCNDNQNGVLVLVNADTLSVTRLKAQLPSLSYHTCSYVPSSASLLVFGGKTHEEYASNALFYINLNSLEVRNIAVETSMNPRFGHSQATMLDRYVIYFGGVDHTDQYFNDVHIFDIETESFKAWSIEGNAPTVRAFHTATLIADHEDVTKFKMIVFGGRNKDSSLGDLHVLNIDTTAQTAHWSPVANQAQFPRYQHSATLFDGVLLFIGGKKSVQSDKDEDFYGEEEEYESSATTSDLLLAFNTWVMQWTRCKIRDQNIRTFSSCTSVLAGERIISFGGTDSGYDEDNYNSDKEMSDEDTEAVVCVFDLEPSSYSKLRTSTSLVQFLGNPFYSDRKLAVGDRHICVQECIITSKIKVLQHLFNENFQESVGDVIKLEDCDFGGLVQLLIHVYGGEPDITGDNFESVFRLAHLYCYNDLVNFVLEQVLQSVDTQNCASLMHLLVEFNLRHMVNKLQTFVANNINQLLSEPDFVDEIKLLNELEPKNAFCNNLILSILESSIPISTVRSLCSVLGVAENLILETSFQPAFPATCTQNTIDSVTSWMHQNLNYTASTNFKNTTTSKPEGDWFIDLGYRVYLQCSHCYMYISPMVKVEATVYGCNESNTDWTLIATSNDVVHETPRSEANLLAIQCNAQNFYRHFKVHISSPNTVQLTVNFSLFGVLRAVTTPRNVDAPKVHPVASICAQIAMKRVAKRGTIDSQQLYHECARVYARDYCEQVLAKLAYFGWLQQTTEQVSVKLKYSWGHLHEDVRIGLVEGTIEAEDLAVLFPVD